MLFGLGKWLLESALILGVFHLAIPPAVHAYTRNSWIKFPVMTAIGIAAGVFMAWLNYLPYFLFFIWLGCTKFSLAGLTGPKFEEEAHMIMRRPVFYVSRYAYVVIACASALFLQVEVESATHSGSFVPLWRHLLGTASIH